ncbi:hypothetical protein ABN097_06565 [Enterobacter cloacae]
MNKNAQPVYPAKKEMIITMLESRLVGVVPLRFLWYGNQRWDI